MRQYRGLTKEGKWVYGWYFGIWEQAYILWGTINDIPDMTEVIPETVGQSTGLKDKNGTEIYEGDIIKVLKEILVGHFHGNINCNVFVRTVIWNSNNGRWVFSCARGKQYLPLEDGLVEIIGTIHTTHPELLEQENA